MDHSASKSASSTNKLLKAILQQQQQQQVVQQAIVEKQQTMETAMSIIMTRQEINQAKLHDDVHSLLVLAPPSTAPSRPPEPTAAPTMKPTPAPTPVCDDPESCRVFPRGVCDNGINLPLELARTVCTSLMQQQVKLSSLPAPQVHSAKTTVEWQDAVFGQIAGEFTRPECVDTGDGLGDLNCWDHISDRSAQLQGLMAGSGGGVVVGSEGILMLIGASESQRVGGLVSAYHLRYLATTPVGIACSWCATATYMTCCLLADIYFVCLQ